MALGIFSEGPSMLASILGNGASSFEGSLPTPNDVHDLTAAEHDNEHLGDQSTINTFDTSTLPSHAERITPDTASFTENMQPADDNEDGVEIVDISMWTRPISAPVSPQQTNVRIKVGSPNEHDPLHANIPDHHDEVARSESPDDVEEIPFSNSPQTGVSGTDQILQSNYPLETITIPQSSQDSSSRYLPQSITFLEGSEQLRQLPDHTYQQIKAFCQAKQTNQPEFIKTKWPPPQTILRTKTGQISWFEMAEGGQRLLAARYRYGPMGQFVVAQDASGTKFNSGKAAVIFHNPAKVMTVKMNGFTYTKYRWTVWDPFGTTPPESSFVWRVMQMESAPSQKPTDITFIHSKSTVQSQTKKRSSSVSLQRPRNDSISRGEDAINAMRLLKRSAPPDDSLPSVKRSRSSTGTIDTSQLKKSYPITGSLGATRDKATGEILLRRKRDGRLIMLQCPYCDSKDYGTQQGLCNHLRISHGLPQPKHDKVVELCGIIIDEPKKSTHRHPSPEQDDNDYDELATEHVVTRSSKRRQTTNEPSSTMTTTNLEDEHLVSQFTFKKSPTDRNPRIRSLGDINSAEKLFVNALVAGVAQKDTLMLTIAVGNREPFHIVRNDKLDFELVMKEIRKAGDGVNVVVSVENLAL